MSTFKQLNQQGVSGDLQLGRRGPRVIVSGGTVRFRNAADNAYTNVEVLDPTAPDHAATKRYVDAVANGLDLKASVRAATTTVLPNNPTYANGAAGVGATLTADSNVAFAAVDGVTLVLNDRLLVKNQATAAHNGIYTLTTVGSGSEPWVLTRATDADQASTEVSAGMFTFVEEGTTNLGRGYVLITANPITIGTTGLSFTQFSDSGTQDPLYRQDTIAFNDSSPVALSLALPSNAIPQRVKVTVNTAWDDSNTTLQVQTTSGTIVLMGTNSNDLFEANTFLEEMLGAVQVGANNQLQAVLAGGAPTTGAATIHVEYALA